MSRKNIRTHLPQFNSIILSNVEAFLSQLLSDSRNRINYLVMFGNNHTWKTLIQPLEDIDDQLHRYWAPINHINSVTHSQTLHEVYRLCLAKLSKYFTEISHHFGLYQAIQSLTDDKEHQKLNKIQRRVIDNKMRSFRLSGINLPYREKQHVVKLTEMLLQLQDKFEENVLHATQGWYKYITNENDLCGMPPHTIMLARQTAEKKALKCGWIFNLESSSYLSIMKYADSRALRKEMSTAFVTRASDQGPDAGRWDNTVIIENILNARLELARSLNFKNFAQYSLFNKMIKDPKKVIGFLHQLIEDVLPVSKKEFTELCVFAKKEFNIKKLEPWDVAYVSEKLYQKKYTFSQEDLRPYFPEAQVIQGLFNIVNRLFQISIRSISDADVWHPDVHCYSVYDAKDQLCAYFYFDLYARENKRNGAWMDDPCSRRQLPNGDIQIPVAFITCNFRPPIDKCSALLSHDEIVTLFHEFGHALQHMLTKINYLEVSGINGVPWDSVELASQFLEYWAWQKESLLMITKHYQTGKALPDALLQSIYSARNFHAAMQMTRQLELALFDMYLHVEFDPAIKNQVQKILNAVRKKTCVIPISDFNRFQNSFSHIFSGGYAAGYYSYQWSETMAADAFSLFKKKGIFDSHSAKKFLTYILESGGSEDTMRLFRAFRGREPKIASLLKQKGIVLTDCV
ncbi:oligopeptidase A [Coxiella endosymbiont of Amblyomma americanum]|nr:oligopeptidase A [Coxiella endosymbiont of Amblyomma americanum]